jgi:transcriptional regulator with XRE-family HTH domain
MEQGEYKVGLDTLFKILQVFDLKMGEFFGETESPSEKEARDLVMEFQTLSDEARQEVRDFVRFKQTQEAQVTDPTDADDQEGEGEEKP